MLETGSKWPRTTLEPLEFESVTQLFLNLVYATRSFVDRRSSDKLYISNNLTKIIDPILHKSPRGYTWQRGTYRLPYRGCLDSIEAETIEARIR